LYSSSESNPTSFRKNLYMTHTSPSLCVSDRHMCHTEGGDARDSKKCNSQGRIMCRRDLDYSESTIQSWLNLPLTLQALTYLLTYLLTPWCRVLPEQLVKKFPAFHGTRRFITALTSVRHLSLSWASPIQSTYPHPTSWRSSLILSTPIYA